MLLKAPQTKRPRRWWRDD